MIDESTSESWRRAACAWQEWASTLLYEYGRQPLHGQHGDEAARDVIATLAGLAPGVPRCSRCGCFSTRHEVDDEERRECADCECEQFECGSTPSEYDRGRAEGRRDVAKYANAIGQIESLIGYAGARPLNETVAAVGEIVARLAEHADESTTLRDVAHALGICYCTDSGCWPGDRADLLRRVRELSDIERDACESRLSMALADWGEDDGNVLWWRFPIAEPPYCGTPLDDDFPGYVTHWTRLPALPFDPFGRDDCEDR